MIESLIENLHLQDIKLTLSKVLFSRAAGWFLLLLAYVVWCVLDAADVVVAFSADRFQMGATWFGWRSEQSWAPWIIGCVGIATAVARDFLANQGSEKRGLIWGGAFVAAAVIARLLSLYEPFGAIFPWLGLLWSPSAIWAMSLLSSCGLTFNRMKPASHAGRPAGWR